MLKYFVVSDIHSFCTELKLSLKQAGFDNKNKNHILIVIGDLFDRGPDTLGVYKFIMSIPKSRRILIRGNHESLYQELLLKHFPERHDFNNGTVRTFCQIAGFNEQVLNYNYWWKVARKEGQEDVFIYDKKPYEYWDQIRDVLFNHPITKWLKSDEWKDYYELDNFIFTHSFIPVNSEDGLPFFYIKDRQYSYNPNWRNCTINEWEESRWGCPWTKYQEGLFAEEEAKGKTLVVGHWHTSDFFKYLKNIKNSGDIYFSKGLIGIDGGVFIDPLYPDDLIHPQNVLIIENGICYDAFGIKLTEPKKVPIIETVTK